MTTLAVAPDGVWVKSHFYREGPILHMVTYSAVAGNPEIFKASIDLRPILAKVVRAHAKLHKDGKVSGSARDMLVGFSFNPFKAIGSIAKSAASLVNKVGKSKLVASIGNTMKSVVKSKITGAILTGVSFAVPMVGVPALAAYAGANKALSYIDQAKSAVAAAKSVVNKATPAHVAQETKKHLESWAGHVVKTATAEGVHIPTEYKSTLARALKITKDRAENAKKVLASVNHQAKAGNVEAQKLSRIINLAHNARSQLKHISSMDVHKGKKVHVKHRGPAHLNGFPAVLVTSGGKIIPGRYVEKAGHGEAVVLRGGKVYRGNFKAVAGVFGDQNVVGCSNPFRLPAGMR